MDSIVERLMFPLGDGPPLERLQKHWQAMKDTPAEIRAISFLPQLYDIATPISCEIHTGAGSGGGAETRELSTTVWKVRLIPELMNWTGNMHGGAVATLFDVFTSVGITPHAKEGFWHNAGVTRTLNCTYLRPIPLSVDVEEYMAVVTTVVSLSKRMAVVRGQMRKYNEDGSIGDILATCEHGKNYIAVPKM